MIVVDLWKGRILIYFGKQIPIWFIFTRIIYVREGRRLKWSWWLVILYCRFWINARFFERSVKIGI